MREVCINRAVSGDDKGQGENNGWIKDIEKSSEDRKNREEERRGVINVQGSS